MANQEAGDKAEQGKNTEASQRKCAANQEAGGRPEQGMNTEARQRKRAGIRERAQTGIQPWASARPIAFVGWTSSYTSLGSATRLSDSQHWLLCHMGLY